MNSFKFFGFKRKLEVFSPVEVFFELHSIATEEERDKKRAEKQQFFSKLKSLNEFYKKMLIDSILKSQNLIITDTHTHLYSEAFDADRNDMINRAIKQGVTRFFIPAIDSAYTESMFLLEKAYPDNIFLMAGLHPTHVKDNYKDELKHVEGLLAKRHFYAVGEIGIDLYWDASTLEIQKKAFRHQIKLAKQYKLPIVIHCRDAFNEIFAVLKEEKSDDLFGIFHCFTGTLEQAHQAISYNMKLGIGGVATFKNGKIDQFLNHINLKHIVLETDAPYLAPVPYRGKRNESAYILKVLEKLSHIYNRNEAEIAKITTENSIAVFKN